MKILQVCPLFPPSPNKFSSGVTNVVYNLSKDLVKNGHEVSVYTTAAINTKKKLENIDNPTIIDGIYTYYFPYIFHHYTFFVTPKLIKFLKNTINNFDIIHIHEHRTFQSMATQYYAKKNNIPYIIQNHGSAFPPFQNNSIIKNFIDILFGNRILKDASKIIALTKDEKDQYRKFQFNDEQIVIIPNGTDLSRYSNLPRKGSFRKKFFIKDEDKIILYLGRINIIKGIETLFKAFKIVNKESDNLKLLIVGPDDNYLSNLKKIKSELELENKIIFTGPLYGRDKLEAYVDAYVYILPSIYETFPMTVVESLACCTPVIVTDRCGISDLIKENNVGYVVKYDAEDLKQALIEILSDRQIRENFSENCLDLVKQEFDLNFVIEKLEDIYKTVINK